MAKRTKTKPQPSDTDREIIVNCNSVDGRILRISLFSEYADMDKAEIVARLNNGALDINGDDLIELAEVMEKRARTPGYQSNTTLRIARELRDAANALMP